MSRRWLVLAIAALVLVVVAAGYWFAVDQERSVRMQAEDQLASIAVLKVAEIARWREDSLADAWRTAQGPGLRGRVARWEADPSAENAELVRQALVVQTYGGRYADALIVDPAGQVLASAARSVETLHPVGLVAVQRSIAAGAAVISDLHAFTGDSPHIDIAAPVYAENDPSRIIGVVILQASAHDFLYPLIAKWPTPSRSAETLLVMKVGSDVLFLNDIRHKEDAALSLREPLTNTRLPATQAVLGRTGIFEGVDYRGAVVLSYLAHVPDSPWYMVAKVDRAEALAEWRTRAALIALVTLALSGVVVGVVIIAWQQARHSRLAELLAVEHDLRMVQERFKVTLTSVGDAIISTDAECRVEFMNPVAEELTGWPAHEARGRPLEEVFDIYNEDTGERAESPAVRVFREGVVVGLANHTALRCRDGRLRPIADSGAPIHNETGITGVVLVFRDQATERAAARELAESEERFRALVEGAPDAMFVQTDSKFAYVNPAAVRLYGAESPEDLLGEPIPHRVAPEYREIVRERIRMLNVDKEGPDTIEQRHLRLDGTSVAVEVSGVPIVYGGKDGAVVTVRDITERKANQVELEQHRNHLEALVAERTAELGSANAELAEATRAKSRFLAKMSHELRTPLNSILGFSSLLLEGMAGPLSDEQRTEIEMINKSGTHLLALISDVLNLSKIEAGKEELHLESLDPAGVVDEVVESLKPLAEEKGLVLTGDVPELGRTIRSDRSKIRQILYNLVGNAVKFTTRGTVDVVLDYDSDGRTMLTVSDTGPGIAESDLPRIFDAFAQIDYPENSRPEGTGLGLAISHEYTHLLNGELTVWSELGVGSTFTLILSADWPRPA